MTEAPVPALPPVPGGVTDEDVRPAGRNMLDVLREDHEQLVQLCDRLSSEDSPTARDVEDVLVATLSRHLSAEEQYLYPTVRKVLPDGDPIADHEVAADTVLLEALRRLHATPREDAGYTHLVNEVAAYVRQHADRTSHEVFPRLAEQCTDNQLIRLGNRVEIAREAAPTRPHPGTPSTPPLNKLVDPAVGVVDKVRDVLAGRTTWPEDLAK